MTRNTKRALGDNCRCWMCGPKTFLQLACHDSPLWGESSNCQTSKTLATFLISLSYLLLELQCQALNQTNDRTRKLIFKSSYELGRSRDSVVGIATGYRLDGWGVGIRVPKRSSLPALGCTQPPIQRVLEALSQEVKRPGREADHSSPASAGIKKIGIYTSTPPYAFLA
jgi:hypothetical protein